MSEIEYLTLEDVIGLVRALGVGPVRDIGLLDSAVARPRASAFGDDAYPTLHLKAAAILHSLTRHHSLVDGNKRLAWLSTTVFLKINGWTCHLDDDQVFSLVWDVASHDLDLGAIARRMKLKSEGGARDER